MFEEIVRGEYLVTNKISNDDERLNKYIEKVVFFRFLEIDISLSQNNMCRILKEPFDHKGSGVTYRDSRVSFHYNSKLRGGFVENICIIGGKRYPLYAKKKKLKCGMR